MKAKNFEKYRAAFRRRQAAGDYFVQKAVIRKSGGGVGREIRTLHIMYSNNYRPGQHITAYATMQRVCKMWNEAMRDVAVENDLAREPEFALDGRSMTIIIKGSTIKISINMTERKPTND